MVSVIETWVVVNDIRRRNQLRNFRSKQTRKLLHDISVHTLRLSVDSISKDKVEHFEKEILMKIAVLKADMYKYAGALVSLIFGVVPLLALQANALVNTPEGSSVSIIGLLGLIMAAIQVGYKIESVFFLSDAYEKFRELKVSQNWASNLRRPSRGPRSSMPRSSIQQLPEGRERVRTSQITLSREGIKDSSDREQNNLKEEQPEEIVQQMYPARTGADFETYAPYRESPRLITQSQGSGELLDSLESELAFELGSDVEGGRNRSVRHTSITVQIS